MKSLSDEQLMAICQNHKDNQGQAALDCLYNRYAKKMHSYFYFTLNNNFNKAQDFVHDLFVKVIENNYQFDSSFSFKTWIYRIASNMCKNEFRNNSVVQKYKAYIKNTEVTFENPAIKEEHLRNCINYLDHGHRSMIVMRFKLKLSIKEIATIYECPEGTVKSRLFYATKELSRIYKL